MLQIRILLTETEGIKTNEMQESSLKWPNPELIPRKVKGRGRAEEYFGQRKWLIQRPEAVMQKYGIKAIVNTGFHSHTQVPGWSLRACIFLKLPGRFQCAVTWGHNWLIQFSDLKELSLHPHSPQRLLWALMSLIQGTDRLGTLTSYVTLDKPFVGASVSSSIQWGY